MPWDDAAARALLRQVFDAALAAASPALTLSPHLPEKPKGRCVVVGAGKSAGLMAATVESAWPDVALSGVVVTKYGHAVPTARITVLQASHPVPDAASEIAARAVLNAVRGLGPDDLVLALISGGGSALMALPAPGVTLADKQRIGRELLASGATIEEMNAVRCRLSAIKGGGLAAACAPARVVTLAISDVPGDAPWIIASGPTVPPPDYPLDAMAIARRYAIVLPDLPPPHSIPAGVPDFRLIATPMMALQAAAAAASKAGVAPLILGDALEGESSQVGRVLAGLALSAATHGTPAPPPCLLLSGGETTVTLAGPRDHAPAHGGRNTEFLAALALHLGAHAAVHALAADTDGIDGTDDAAGAVVTPSSLARARALGLDVRAMLARHDTYTLFAALGDLVITGPTLTNVNDFRAILIT